MEFSDVIRKRFSARKYSDKKIEREKLENVLEAGRIAPTAKNIQPIKIYVVESNEGLEKMDKATRCRFNAPIVLLVCGDKEEAYSNPTWSSYEMDASIVTTHMILEATNQGLNSVWVELFDKEIVREEFQIPNNLIPVALMPLGYKTDDCPTSPMHNNKKELSEIVEYK